MTRSWGWLETFMVNHELSLDVPLPDGVEAGSVSALQEWTASLARNRVAGVKFRNHGDGGHGGAHVRSCRMPGLPVFSVEWGTTVEGCPLERFLAFSMTNMSELAPMWDDTYIDSADLATHGSSCDLTRYAKLVRWHFRMPAPFRNREMLYLVVPIVLSESATLVNYFSVRSPRHPVEKGYVRAYNAAPSFDLAEVKDGDQLVVRHLMTTRIGGWVSDRLVWNTVFRGPVIKNNAHEGAKVRALLEQELSQGGIAQGG